MIINIAIIIPGLLVKVFVFYNSLFIGRFCSMEDSIIDAVQDSGSRQLDDYSDGPPSSLISQSPDAPLDLANACGELTDILQVLDVSSAIVTDEANSSQLQAPVPTTPDKKSSKSRLEELKASERLKRESQQHSAGPEQVSLSTIQEISDWLKYDPGDEFAEVIIFQTLSCTMKTAVFVVLLVMLRGAYSISWNT